MISRRDLANALRALSMDAVQQANSGHPGMPMGMADIAQVLWSTYLKHNPNNPHWSNRDRFVLSNGHGAMLLYSLLHLTGYDLTIEDLKAFRQLGSRTPGHPEIHETPGVETTTGPLGQGLANAVGMALAEKILSAQFNRDNFPIIDHRTYVFLGDGCLMEGISHEACSLAGTWKLSKLIAFWDDNGISIDGTVEGWFTDDTPNRFEAYHWNVIRNIDGHDPDAIQQAIQTACQSDHPTLICCRTMIGYGAPCKANTANCHGSPLGFDEIEAARKQLEWSHPPFHIPPSIAEAWDARGRGAEAEAAWNSLFQHYREKYPDLAQELTRRLSGQLPATLEANMTAFLQECHQHSSPLATRKASLKCLDTLFPLLPELLGGSADLSESNCTLSKHSHTLTQDDFSGNYLHYGVREFGMSAIMNGIALHGGFIPYGGTFLTFLDYARNAVRLSALMKQRVIYIFTHDSIGLGEDGPTHQPIEHITMLRATPNVLTWRPANAVETAVAWQESLLHTTGPSCLLLSRQDLPAFSYQPDQLAQIQKGGYVLKDHPQPKALIMATGSEVTLAIKAAEILEAKGIGIRVISMPCVERFLQQPQSYQQQVLPEELDRRVAVEAGASLSWYRWVGPKGRIVGLDHFGQSAPAKALFEAFGFTSERVAHEVDTLLKIP